MAYNVLNKQDFEQELEDAGDKLVVIDFYANWCGPCKIIDPQLQELSAQYAHNAIFLKVNVDDCEDIAMNYNITSMPTFVFVKQQQIVDVLVGSNVDKLVKNIEKYVEGVQTTVRKHKDSVQEYEETGIQNDENASEYNLDVDDLDDPTSVLEVIVDDQM